MIAPQGRWSLFRGSRRIPLFASRSTVAADYTLSSRAYEVTFLEIAGPQESTGPKAFVVYRFEILEGREQTWFLPALEWKLSSREVRTLSRRPALRSIGY